MATSGGSHIWTKLQKELEQSSSGSALSLETPVHLSIESEINQNRQLLLLTIHCGRHHRSHDPFLQISATPENTSSLVTAFADALFDDLGIPENYEKGQTRDSLMTVAENISDPVAIAYAPYDKRLMMTPLSFSCRKVLMNAAGEKLDESEMIQIEFKKQEKIESVLTAADDLMDVSVDEMDFMAPILSTVNAQGVEGSSIPLQIGASSMNIFSEDHLSFEISNVPEDVMLSVGQNDGHGVWTIAYDQIHQVSLIASRPFKKGLDLLVKAIAFGDQGKMAMSVSHLLVKVDPVAIVEVPISTESDVIANDENAIPLTIDAALVSGNEDLSIIITGVPNGAVLSAGCDQGGGTWLLSVAQVKGLAVIPPSSFKGDFNIRVQVISAGLNGNTSIATQDIDVCVIPTADEVTHVAPSIVDAPNQSTLLSESTQEEQLNLTALPIPIQIAIELHDPDHEELINVVVSGVPEGSHFSSGVDNGDGSWTLSPLDLDDLTWIPSPGFTGKVKLTVKALVEDLDGRSFSVKQVLPVRVS